MTTSNDIQVQCTRCRNKHMESERPSIPKSHGISTRVCPRCGGHSYYDIRPQVAWCWVSGLIEVGNEDSVPDGCIVVARGPKSYLHGVVAVVARHGYGDSAGQLLVPGVPEADDQQAASDALAHWLKWCAKGNGHRGRNGVVFEASATEIAA